MHWLLWLSLTEAEPNNVSRLKHLSCLLCGHTPLQTPSLDFKTWRKAADEQDFIMGNCYSYKSHIITLCEFSVQFWDVQVQGEAVLSEPSCQAHLCFYSKASSEEGAGVPRAGVMGMRALNQPQGSLSHGKRHPSPLLQREAMPFPCLLSSICRSPAATRTGTCSMGRWAASCDLEHKLGGLVWGWPDKGQAAQSSLYSRHKTKNLSGSSELPNLF